MDNPTPPAHVFRFGVFELDSDSGELRRHGLKIRLPDQSFQILRLLLSRPGEVVTREELRQVLWTSDTFVDFDVGLNSAVRKLREALDDAADNPRFVETLPRRGYRFVGPLTAPAAEPLPASLPAPLPPARSGLSVVRLAAGLLLVAVVAVVVVAYQRGGFGRAGTAAKPIRTLVVLPFENLTGDAAQDYFVDAVTDAVTTHLAQVDALMSSHERRPGCTRNPSNAFRRLEVS